MNMHSVSGKGRLSNPSRAGFFCPAFFLKCHYAQHKNPMTRKTGESAGRDMSAVLYHDFFITSDAIGKDGSES